MVSATGDGQPGLLLKLGRGLAAFGARRCRERATLLTLDVKATLQLLD